MVLFLFNDIIKLGGIMAKIDFKSRRQIDLIKKYYALDEDKKEINVNLYYDNVEDILNTKIGNKDNMMFKDEVIDEINNIISKNPIGFKMNIDFNIKDYNNYDPKKLISSFNDTLELKQYSLRKERQTKDLVASFLVLIGVLLLFIMVLGKNYWFSNDTKGDILYEVINIVAWVFVWEAATMYFLDHSKDSTLALRIRAKIKTISFYNEDNLLIKEDSENIFGSWENEGALKRIGKTSMLISSIVMIFLSFYSYYNLYLDYSAHEGSKVSLVLITIIISIILLYSGILGILKYLGKNINIRVNNFFVLLLLILILIKVIISGSILNIVSISIAFVVYIIFMISSYFDKN